MILKIPFIGIMLSDVQSLSLYHFTYIILIDPSNSSVG